MRINRIIRHNSADGPEGVNATASITAVVSVNVNGSGGTTARASSRQSVVHRRSDSSIVHEKGVRDGQTREGL